MSNDKTTIMEENPILFTVTIKLNPQLLEDWHLSNLLDLRETTENALRVECEEAIRQFLVAMDNKDERLYERT